MEEVYAALLLHKAGKEINEGNLKKVLEATGVQAEDAKLKALVASLDGVNIDEAIKEAAVATPSVATAPVAESGTTEEKKEEKKEEEGKSTEEAAAGLGALFG